MKELSHDLEMDFERLLYYVQHPKTLCYTALSLGGNKETPRTGRTATKSYAKTKQLLSGSHVWCTPSGIYLFYYLQVTTNGLSKKRSSISDEVYTFDPSLKLGAHQHKRQHMVLPFWDLTLTRTSKFVHKEMKTWRMRTLDAIIEFLGHQDKTIDVLKMDIEGDEWNKVNHLCIEVHLHSGDWSRKLHILRKLEIEGQMRFFSSRKNLVSKPKSVPGLKNRTEQLFYELAWFRDS
ncbi:methyltransf_21 domain-containing protein [Caerostris extrusa]|uniref:Methyltransf_21 domain-containing protein n=1 Tax=Caerostris extrusa TaxID=172846 RepID=A0AAV4MZN9_CAEEX|nr:methyltransf_21 domain-containing protein [Caerostris extrusa]